MKKILLILPAAALLAGACSKKSGGGVKLRNDTDSVAYVIGMNVGMNLLRMDSTINVNAVCEGIRDAVNRSAKLSAADAETFYLRYVNYALPEKARAYEEQFLADIAKSNRSYARTSSGVTYTVTAVGDQEQVPVSDRDSVALRWVIRTADGSRIASSYEKCDTVRSLLRGPKSDVAVMSVTFFLTVIFNLTIAIEIGMLMAIFVFVKRVSETTHVVVLRDRLDTRHHSDVSPNEDDKMDLAAGVEVYEIDGPFFFGIANKFDDLMRGMGDKPLIRIIRMRKVPFVDSTGAHNLETFIHSSQKEHIHIILSGVRPEVHETLERMGIEAMVGADNIFRHINKAVLRANALAPELARARHERHHHHHHQQA